MACPGGDVLTYEKLRRGVLHGEVQTTGSGFTFNGELYMPVADEGETDDQR